MSKSRQSCERWQKRPRTGRASAPLRCKALADALRLLHDIFNDAWSENWRFVSFT